MSFNVSDENLTQTDETFRNRFLDLPETNTPTGDRRDPRSDLTAACAILYYCLTGHIPGQLQDGSGTLPHLRRGHSLRDKHTDERVPYLEEFFTRGFAPNIANRYQQIEEIQEKLRGLLRSGGPLDESDPLQVAAKLSQQLRAHDRITQVAEFRTHATTLINYIVKEETKYRGKLGRFQLQNAAIGLQPKLLLPAGLDLVEKVHFTVALTADHHPYQRHRQYAIASRSEQCVLLAADYTANTKQRHDVTRSSLHYSEIVWYEGSPESIFSLVSVSYRDWVTAQLKGLAREILPASP